VSLSDLPWALNIIALGVGSHLALTFFLLLRYLETRRRTAGLWAVAYALLAAQAGLEVMLPAAPAPGWIVGRWTLTLLPALLLFGSFPENGGRLIVAAVGAALSAAAAWPLVVAGWTWPWASLPAAAAAALLFLVVAASYRRAEAGRGDLATHLVRWGFALTGLVELSYPFMRPVGWGSLAAGLASGLVTILLGVGLVLRSWHDTRELEVMSAIARMLNRLRNVREASAEVLGLVASLLGVESGWVFLRDRERYGLAAAHGLPPRLAADGAAAMAGECRCLTMLTAGQFPLAVNIVDCQRMERAGLPHTRHASVPLRASASVVGLMNLILPRGRAFDDRQLQMLSALGHQIGLAVERGLLFDEVAAKERLRGELLEKLLTAHEDERRRIARELHDEAGQALTALIVNLELVAQEPSADRLRVQLGQLRELAERTLGEIRRLIYDLRPSILDDLGLAAALRWCAKNLLDPRGIAWTLSVSGIAGRLPAGLETVAFRLVQEALTNVLRHAEASSVAVRVALEGRELHIRIEDNGRGFDPRGARPAERPGGLGLLGMQERVELVGGRWEVQSTPGVGTRVSAVLPVRSEQAGA
jgi:signal transduction histidine kinase